MAAKNFIPILSAILFLSTCKEAPTESHSFVPVPQNDNWPISTPEAQGLDPHILASGFDAARNLPYSYSLLVVRHGNLVAEEYFHGSNVNMPNDVRSVSKSFLSAVTGVALDQGILDSLDHRALGYFPEYTSPSIDSAKFNITIRHLLTMRAGFPADEDVYSDVYSSSDWIRSTINLPLINQPGTHWVYCTFETHLLSAILTKASGRSTRELVNQYLCEPLGISLGFWQQDPQGYYFGGNAMGFKVRDLARFGSLYLHHGALNGIQIVPQAWVDQSLTNLTGWQNLTWGDLVNYNYGYLWWMGTLNGHEVKLALGHGGQYVMIVPDLDLVAVSTSDWQFDWNTADEHERTVLHILGAYVVGAVQN